jgi:histidinol-phosphate/aromatic aminotransferase/cobyric acid decarboxylase-like protein
MDIHDYAEQKRLSLKQIMDFTTSVNPLGPSSKAKHLLRKNCATSRDSLKKEKA